jgi:hypothetical protein
MLAIPAGANNADKASVLAELIEQLETKDFILILNDLI